MNSSSPMEKTLPKVAVIVGPTATGKTKIAVEVALRMNGEIVSADSRQVYRGMDLGTGKDLAEYKTVPHHLIDILEPVDKFSVSEFKISALNAIEGITKKGGRAIVCGGTGHYIKALVENYQFNKAETNRKTTEELESKSRSDLYRILKEKKLWSVRDWKQDSKRRIARAIEVGEYSRHRTSGGLAFNYRIFHTDIDRANIRSRIKDRLNERLEAGLIEEVIRLQEEFGSNQIIRFGLEYKWIPAYLNSEISYSRMKDKLIVQIGRYAKRQQTFLSYLRKSGHRLYPIHQNNPESIEEWLF